MNKSLQDKFDDLNHYVQQLENNVKKGIKVNIFIYACLCIILLMYATYITKQVHLYTSAEEGPETLIAIVESSLPGDEALLSHAKAEIPSIIEDTLEQIWSMIPVGEQMFMEGINSMTEHLAHVIEKEIGPELTGFLVEQVASLKEKYPDLHKADAKKFFNQAVRIYLRETLTDMVDKAEWKILDYKMQLQKYRRSNASMTAKEYAEKRALLTFIRLGDDPEYRDQLAKLITQSMDGVYERLLSR